MLTFEEPTEKTKGETYGNQNITLVLEKAAQICWPEVASL